MRYFGVIRRVHQRQSERMFQPQLIVCDDVLLYASAATCASLQIGDVTTLARWAGDWLAHTAVQRAIERDGDHIDRDGDHIDVDAGNIAVRLHLRKMPGLPARRIALVEPVAAIAGAPPERQR